MNNNINGIDSKILDIVSQMIEGETVNIERFSQEEQREIQETLAIIQGMEALNAEPTPSIASFNALLEQIPDPFSERKTISVGGWGLFVKRFFQSKSTWTIIPVLGMMTVAFVFWQQPEAIPASQTLAEAEILSLEIQSDFESVSRELLELEEIEDLLVMTPKDTINQI